MAYTTTKDLQRRGEKDDDPGDRTKAFFERIGADGPCQACKTNNWIILEEVDGVPAVPTYVASTGQPNSAYYPLVLVACAHCGLVRSHLRNFVLGSNPQSGDGD